MAENDTSGGLSSVDPHVAEITGFLAGIEPLVRRRIREIRGPRDPLLSTSGLYATVMEELMVDELARDRAGARRGTARSGMPDVTRNLSRIIRISVTRARRAVKRWRRADACFPPTATDGFDGRVSPLDQHEFRRAMITLIDGLGREDREILYLRMKGNPWATVATTVGMNDVACRQRWVRIVAELRRRFPND